MFKINYTDKYGRPQVHNYRGSLYEARRWTETLSRENNDKRAECLQEADGKTTHILTVGDDGAKEQE